MSMVQTILTKRGGSELTDTQIQSFVDGVVSEDVPDYQASALLMAVVLKGMTFKEAQVLTKAYVNSGEQYDLSFLDRPTADKHSTGGVGDKVSLILAPLAAACGLAVPMMSGRGLGITGGTLDKLESIRGFDVNLGREEFFQVLKDHGCAMIGQSRTMVPADRKLYALRDVTGTVDSIPLIVASILSKKIAEGTQNLVLDIKVGSGAFMKTRSDARRLATWLMRLATARGMHCEASLTTMDQPLGFSVGNSLELYESIRLMRDGGDPEFPSCDLRELTLHLVGSMLHMSGLCKSLAQGRRLATQRLQDGSAWKTFQAMVKAQGGELEELEHYAQAPHVTEIAAPKAGWVSKIPTGTMGQALIDMGGGRQKATDTIDHRVGICFYKKVGQRVRKGEPLMRVYSKNLDDSLLETITKAVQVTSSRKATPPLLLNHLTPKGSRT